MTEQELALQAENSGQTMSFGNKLRFYGSLVAVTTISALAAVGCGGSSDKDPGSSPATGGGDPIELEGGAQAGGSGSESGWDGTPVGEPSGEEGCTGPYAGNPDLDDRADGVCRVGVAGSDCWGYAVKPEGFRDDLYILNGGTIDGIPLSRVIDCIEGYTGIELGSPEDFIDYSRQDQTATESDETDGNIDTSIGSGKVTYYVSPDSPIPWGQGNDPGPAVKDIDPDTMVEDADVPPYSIILINRDTDAGDLYSSGAGGVGSFPILGKTIDLVGLEALCEDDAMKEATQGGEHEAGVIQFFDSQGLYGMYMCFIVEQR